MLSPFAIAIPLLTPMLNELIEQTDKTTVIFFQCFINSKQCIRLILLQRFSLLCQTTGRPCTENPALYKVSNQSLSTRIWLHRDLLKADVLIWSCQRLLLASGHSQADVLIWSCQRLLLASGHSHMVYYQTVVQ
jgi:hypothetical protein